MKKRQIIMLPIEPLDSRYSIQWKQWFTEAIKADGRFELLTIDPQPLTTEITSGAFLDVCGTNYYKAKQLSIVAMLIHNNQVQDDAVFFLHDAWFPGVEQIAYMRDALGKQYKITGCMHAGTYDPTDFISKKGMGFWGLNLENAWFRIFDSIFVATKYHKDLIAAHRELVFSTVKVTGFPLQVPMAFEKSVLKEKIVVFPHRLTDDKNPEAFNQLRDIIRLTHRDWQFIRTQDERRTKQEYYDLLRRSMIAVSFAEHENWGIGMQEASLLGAFPVVPDRLSYKELYLDFFKYRTFADCVDKVSALIKRIELSDISLYPNLLHPQQNDISNKCAAAIPNILESLYHT